MKGADPVAGVEMASTGEVACFGDDLEEAFYTSWLATEQSVKGKNVFLSLPDEQKHKFIDETAMLVRDGWTIYATEGTHNFFKQRGIKSTRLHKIQENKQPSVAGIINSSKVDLIVSVPSLTETNEDAYKIRRLAIDNHIPLLTNAETGRLLLKCLTDPTFKNLQPKPWSTYVP